MISTDWRALFNTIHYYMLREFVLITLFANSLPPHNNFKVRIRGCTIFLSHRQPDAFILCQIPLNAPQSGPPLECFISKASSNWIAYIIFNSVGTGKMIMKAWLSLVTRSFPGHHPERSPQIYRAVTLCVKSQCLYWQKLPFEATPVSKRLCLIQVGIMHLVICLCHRKQLVLTLLSCTKDVFSHWRP